MKLHLPLSLRSALLAACCALAAFSSSSLAASAEQDYEWVLLAAANGAYWTDASGAKHTLSRDTTGSLGVTGALEFVLQGNTNSGSEGGALIFKPSGSESISAKNVIINDNKIISSDSAPRGGALLINNSSLTNSSASPYFFAFTGCDEVTITNNGAQQSSNLFGGYYSYEEDGLYATAGAICVQGAAALDENKVQVGSLMVLEFKNNQHVTIRGNYVTDGTNYELQAIETLDADVAFAAPAGGSIECYDGISVDGILWINTTHPQLRDSQSYTGTVTISGEYAAADLKKLKGKEASEDELEGSKWVEAEKIYVNSGTLILKDLVVSIDQDVSYTKINGTHFESDPNAEVQLTDVCIATILSDQDFDENPGGGWSTSGEDDFPYQYGSVSLGKASFTGVNVMLADYVTATGTWTFNVGAVNKDKAVLTIEFDNKKLFDSRAHELDTTNKTFRVNVLGSLAKGEYKLLEFNKANGSWKGMDTVSLEGAASGKIGSAKGSAVYYKPSGNMLTLVFDYGSASAAQRAATTLTWVAGSGTWAEGKGNSEKTWSGTVSDLNFYSGDSVVFNKAASVEVSGVVLPQAVTVSHASGQVILAGSDGCISGSASLTKTGEGELVLNLANAYTGDTVLQAGKITAGNDMALGLSVVRLQGGTLALQGLEVGNEVRVSQAAEITGGSQYAGKLVLEGGALSGEALRLAQEAELLSGSVANDLFGPGSFVKTGDGEVKLTGQVSVDGESSVNGGVLQLSSGSFSGQLVVNSGAELQVAPGYALSGHFTLNEGASVTVADGFSLKDGDILTLSGAELHNGVTVSGGTLEVTTAGQSIGGDLTLSGGMVSLADALEVEGRFSTTAVTHVSIAVKSLIRDGGVDGHETYYIHADDDSDASLDHIRMVGLEGSRAVFDSDEDGLWVWLKYEKLIWDAENTGTWAVENGGEWKAENENINDKHFYNLDFVTFEDAGEVQIEGDVNPGKIMVLGEGNTIFTGAGHVVGEADLIKEGSGILRIETDNSSYTGVIAINGGTLEVGSDNALGRGDVFINNAVFNGGDFVVSNRVSFSGNSHMTRADGVSTVVFKDQSVVSGSYTLATGNTLIIESGGATFTGDFTFAGGTLALTGGVFHLTGGVEFAEGGLSRAGDGSLTTIDLSGWAGLAAGTYELATLVTEEDAARYFTLAGLEESLARRAYLEYADDVLLLTIRRLGISQEIAAALNRNQRAAYEALGAIAEQEEQPGGELAAIMAAVLDESDPNVVRSMMDRLDGAELATAMLSQIAGNMSHLHRLRANMGSGQFLSKEGDRAAYVVGYDETHRYHADANGPGIHRSEWGGALGFEYALSKSTFAGASLNSGWTKVRPTGGQRYDEDDTRVDLYLVSQLDSEWKSVTSIGFGLHDYSISRRLPGDLAAHADMDGYSFNFLQEISYTRNLNEESSLQPFFLVESSFNSIRSFAEGGAGTASLIGSCRHAWATDLTLGARYIHSFKAEGMTGQLSLQTGLVASIGDTTSDLNLRFAGAPNVGFNVASASRERLGYQLGAGLLLPVSKDTAVSASTSAVLRGDSHEYSANVGVRVRF